MAVEGHTFKRYHYDPSLAAAVIFAVLFGLSGIMHAFQIFKHRTWYFTSFFIGVLFEFGGYAARAVNANQTPDWTDVPFIIQTLLLLVAPALFAASIYMILGRLIRVLEAERLSIIRTTWLTKIFVLGDVLSFLVQAGGGVMAANADSVDALNRGQNLVLVGLGIQILFFGLFIAAISIFHIRIVRHPTTASLETVLPWKRYLLVLYAVSFLIMVRSIFRVAEFAAGQDSVLQTTEAYLYCLDASLMLICAVLFNIQHPSIILQTTRYKPSPNHVELLDA
ncbi:RTA1 like protein-domain-containing protein [Thelonectria olida]|uniref:RTA1 like protein-domain-containing protein n=1 Tax=Thelonectria olida TaxID=1576542 RepID=A0A9P9AKI2_9HYPO|nr:RTA1 like protein-domain-containing protein [Thelonectria olida]